MAPSRHLFFQLAKCSSDEEVQTFVSSKMAFRMDWGVMISKADCQFKASDIQQLSQEVVAHAVLGNVGIKTR